MKVTARGTYSLKEDYMIDVDQTEHSMGLKGKYYGRFEIKGDTLRLVFNPVPGRSRPPDLGKAGAYKRE